MATSWQRNGPSLRHHAGDVISEAIEEASHVGFRSLSAGSASLATARRNGVRLPGEHRLVQPPPVASREAGRSAGPRLIDSACLISVRGSSGVAISCRSRWAWGWPLWFARACPAPRRTATSSDHASRQTVLLINLTESGRGPHRTPGGLGRCRA